MSDPVVTAMATRIATAEWADPAEVEQRYRYRDGTIWLGRAANAAQAAIGYRDDRHVCLVSGSRGGKGTSSIINNLILWPGSVCVVDPKGENATITARRRGAGSYSCEGLKQSVRLLDPFKTAEVDDALRARFNPLDTLDPRDDEAIDEAGRIADALVVVHETTNDPFWDESARAMVKGLILHVLTAPEYEGRRNLITVRKLIMRGDWEAVEALKEAGEQDIPSGHGLLWTGLANNQAFDGLVAGLGDSFANMLLNAPKQFESVLQVANRNTEFIDSPAMQRCLEASDFALSELKTRAEGLSLYLCLPQRYMSTHYRWLRMIISLTVTEMEKVRGQPVCGHPILMVLDEFAGLKRMEIIESAVAQIAGYGVKLFMAVQSLEQLKAVYKENWETFLANSGLKVFFNLEDNFSREYVSRLVGETELVREVRSASDSTSQSESMSHGTSRSEGTNSSVSSGTSGSVNSSRTRSSGSSVGESWGPQTLFGGKENLRFSEGENWSHARTVGESRGWSEGRSQGVSHGASVTDGTSSGTSQSRTAGVSETIQKRALVTPDEIGQLFARVDDPQRAAYPGLALAVISGARPVAVRRVNYYEDAQFIGRFERAADYSAQEVRLLKIRPECFARYFKWFDGMKLKRLVGMGAVVNQGQALLSVAIDDATVAFVRSPVDGRVYAGDDIPLKFGIMHYGNSLACDPLAELKGWAEGIGATFGRDLRKWWIWGGLAGVLFLIIVVALIDGPGMPWEFGVLMLALFVMRKAVKKVRKLREALGLWDRSVLGEAVDPIDSQVVVPAGTGARMPAGGAGEATKPQGAG